MASCPFCSVEVEEDLVRFGGHCPACLIEIPGEEAPTDHGEVKRANMVAEADAARSKRNKRLGVLLGMLFLVSGVGAWQLVQWRTETPVLAVEDDFAIVPLSQHEDLAIPAESSGTPGADTGASTEAVAASGGGSSASSGRRTSTGGRVSGGSARPKTGSMLGTGNRGISDPMAAFGPTVGPRRVMPESIVLTDAGQIEAMVKRVLERGSKQLQQCYERRLNAIPDLAGSWRLRFVVTPKGAASQVSVRSLSSRDSELEGCMKRNVADWKFQSISEAVEINKTYRFSPS